MESSEHHKKDIAEYLVSHNLLLTALEYYTELSERGIHIQILKDFFSNPRNFENYNDVAKRTHNRSRSIDNVSLNSMSLSIDENNPGIYGRLTQTECIEALKEKNDYIARK
jgi:hypothetical protein